jgi:hypothetical protein
MNNKCPKGKEFLAGKCVDKVRYRLWMEYPFINEAHWKEEKRHEKYQRSRGKRIIIKKNNKSRLYGKSIRLYIPDYKD